VSESVGVWFIKAMKMAEKRRVAPAVRVRHNPLNLLSGEKSMRDVLTELPGLDRVLDAIIPFDGHASATQANVHRFLDRVFSKALAAEWEPFRAGFAELEAAALQRCNAPLSALDEAQMTDLLSAVETGHVASARWFGRLVELATEGYYADPGAGGNADEASWKMIGYSRRLPANYPIKVGEW
jgi:hypothetical protein